MAQFESQKDGLEGAQVQAVFIAAEKRDGLFRPEKFLAAHPIAFPFLLDEDRTVTKAYGVYQRLGLDALNIARPATFLVSSQGVIRFAHVGRSQTDRVLLADALRETTGR
jgi:peroxiredoxin